MTFAISLFISLVLAEPFLSSFPGHYELSGERRFYYYILTVAVGTAILCGLQALGSLILDIIPSFLLIILVSIPISIPITAVFSRRVKTPTAAIGLWLICFILTCLAIAMFFKTALAL